MADRIGMFFGIVVRSRTKGDGRGERENNAKVAMVVMVISKVSVALMVREREDRLGFFLSSIFGGFYFPNCFPPYPPPPGPFSLRVNLSILLSP